MKFVGNESFKDGLKNPEKIINAPKLSGAFIIYRGKP